MGPENSPALEMEGLVHDLNNVFETISEAAELLEGDPRWTVASAAIQRGVNRGRRIVESLSAGALGDQDFATVVENSIEFARDVLHAVHAPTVEFVQDVEPGTQIAGCTAAWERVLLNLFLNAAQAMPGGGTIEIHARRSEQGADIFVTDNGPGIPAEILPRIFEPHFSTKSSNAGLGLHIVKSLVRQHGGEVSVGNREAAGGAVFHIRVPRA